MTPSDLFAALWHKSSFDHFLSTRLPELLAERLPVSGYTAEAESERTCRISVTLGSGISLTFTNLPQSDPQGLFWLNSQAHIVIPTASHEELDKAEINCAGEQLYAYIAARLGRPGAEIAWDEATARAFLPLEAWFAGFLRTCAQPLDQTNWNSRTTHIRRLMIPNRTRVVAPGQMGRVDPFETPEGPNIGRIFTVALGAEIRGGRLVVVDERPEATLSHNAAQIPFLEYADANRLLMGVNMMRQALIPEAAEPALVQTGTAPDNPGPDFWCGLNLLTAFVAWGEASCEDGLVISESCARRLNFPYTAETGDKLANRHGYKGVVSQVLPDAQMPHLADGTPMEIVCSFSGMARRLMVSLVREAVMGRIARAEGQPAIVPPFQGIDAQQMQARLIQNGLPGSGMEHLRAGQNGPELPYPSTVGWVYWYRLAHLARPKLCAAGQPSGQAVIETEQSLGELDLRALLQAGAGEIAREALTSRAMRGNGQSSPYFQDLTARLAAAGIITRLEDDGKRVSFHLGIEGEAQPIKLAQPLRHPWLPEETLDAVGHPPENSGTAAFAAFDALLQANDRLLRWQSADPGPAAGQPSAWAAGPINSLLTQLESRLAGYLEALLPASALRFNEPQAFSAQAVISPASGLALDQVGLPDAIIETWLGGDANLLDQAFEKTWVIVRRAPALSPTALLAFHPIRTPGASIHLNPITCALLDTDFDGDLVSVFLPLSESAQREAGETLSVEGHLRRDAALLSTLLPPHEGLWGLAALSLKAEGRQQIANVLYVETERIPNPLTSSTLTDLLAQRLSVAGPAGAIRAADALARLGYAACAASGASFSPFPAPQVPLPPAPLGDNLANWEIYREVCAEAILSARDYANPNLGPQLLSAAVRSKERWALPFLFSPGGASKNAEGQVVIARHSPAEGRPPMELFASVAGARQGLARISAEIEDILQRKPPLIGKATVIARARRAKYPGVVFARAAASQETDPLSDLETRVLLGL